MLACMEETKRTFMTGSEGMPTLAKSQVRTLIIQQILTFNFDSFFLMFLFCSFADKSGNETTSDSEGQ